MNVYAMYGEIMSMALKAVKETKCNERTDNVKTVYPPTNSLPGSLTKVKIIFWQSMGMM